MRPIEELLKAIHDFKNSPNPEPLRITAEEDALLEAYKDRQLEEKIDAALNKGDLQGAAYHIGTARNWGNFQQRLLLQYADRFTDPQALFDLIIEVYTSNGYDFPKKLILKAKQLSRQIPQEHRLNELPEGDPVTIYRGCNVANPESGNFVRTAISWTTSKTQAIWFANRISNPNTENGKGVVWEGTIDRDKIIAFTQARHESEVIQHMNVKGQHIIDIPPDEWEAALQYQVALSQAAWEQMQKGD